MGWLILGVLGTIALALFTRWLSTEIGAHYLPFCRWLVKTAAMRLPADERVAAQSEWLAVIEDLRSPTAQLLHSLSFAFSAFRIREAIAPEDTAQLPKDAARLPKLAILALVAGQAVGSAGGALLFIQTNFGERFIEKLQHVPTSKLTVIGVFALVSMLVWGYIAYRVMLRLWLIRIAQRRASTPLE